MNQAPLIVHTDWSKAWGGQEIRTLTELREMKKKGFRVGLVVRENAELARRATREDIPVYYIDFSSKFNLLAWRDLFDLIRRLRPAVINTHSSEDSWMAGCVGKLCRVPLLIKTRHVLAPISSSFSYNAFFDVIFACSESIGKQLVQQGVRAEKIIVQSTGIDEQRFCYSLDQRLEIRKKYGVGEDEILVGNVAFLRHYKGHDFIVKTAATLPEKYRFMIVGGGNARDILEEDIARAGVKDRFILTGHREDPERFFSAIDIIFFSSYETEGISQSFIQGLLYGMPLLTCKTPSILEPLEHVHTYQTIDYGDVEAARSSILALSEQLTRNEKKVASQRCNISKKYGLATMVETIMQTYAKYGVNVDS